MGFFSEALIIASIKGQLISKANCQAEDSSKKRTNEFVFTSMRRVFVRFFEESSARKKTFRDYLTFCSLALFQSQNILTNLCFDSLSRKLRKYRDLK